MDERSVGLIQRAAARLKQAAETNVIGLPTDRAPAQSAPPPAPVAAEPAETGQISGRRSREVTIDRGRLAKAGIAVPSSERSRLVEEVRLIKQEVLRNAKPASIVLEGERSGRLIMVSSSLPREGKTFVAVNLALSISSERDSRVLLIDCDAQRQALKEMLGIDAEQGLVDLLMHPEIDISDVLLRTNIPNLTVLPCGTSGPHVPELLSSNRMSSLLKEMVRRYPDRYIILDAPPCLATSDPSILAALVGQIVFVVEAEKTQEREIEAALRLISACPTISLVLNKTHGSATDQFGSYSYY
jgi:protein-tyrosine kinase